MAITVTSLTSGYSNTSGLSYQTASITPSANKVVLLACSELDNGEIPSSVSGCNLTWTQVAVEQSGDWSLALWRGIGASPTTGPITITYPATQIRCRWSVIQLDGVDTANPVVQAATNYSAGATTLTVTLGTFSSGDNRPYGCFSQRSELATTPGSGFTEIHDINAVGMPNLQAEWQNAVDTTVDASWGSAYACKGIALELKALAVGLPLQVLVNMVGA